MEPTPSDAGEPEQPRPIEAVAGLGEPRHTRLDVHAATGMPLEQTRRFWRAMGFADVGDDDVVFTDTDVATVHALAALLDGGVVQPEAALQLTRVMGQALARVAEAQVSAFRERMAAVRGRVGPEEADEASFAAWLELLRPSQEAFLLHLYRRHLVAAVRRTEGTPAGMFGPPVAVGFADLVGFTAMSQELDGAGVALVVDRFESLAFDAVLDHGGRVIKVVGDEVMFEVASPGAAVRIGLGVAAACAEDPDIPDVRVGVAWGPTVQQEGDLYGPTVNRAARAVHVARPGTVLVDDELAQALGDGHGFRLRPLRRRNLQGIGRVQLHAVQPAATEAP